MLAFAALISTGFVGPPAWNWIRVTLLSASLLGTFVVTTVPDHFLRDHPWHHVFQKHALDLFAWTFGVLLAVAFLGELVDLGAYVQRNVWGVLVASGLMGIISESGPHLIFVTMFAEGLIPISILVASSIVQDGHGMLPLLAESRRDFLWIKGINLVIGLSVGALLLAFGY